MYASLAFLLLASSASAEPLTLRAGEFSVQVDEALRTRVGNSIFAAREFLGSQAGPAFSVETRQATKDKLVVHGGNGTLQKILIFEAVGPDRIVQTIQFKNQTQKPLRFKGWQAARAEVKGAGRTVAAFLPGSYEARPDWIKKIQPGFKQTNFMGMNATDYGGGTPFLALWTKEEGISIASVEPKSQLISLPVIYGKDGSVQFHIESQQTVELAPGETLTLPHILWQRFQGDAFLPLRRYSLYMSEKAGLMMSPSPMAQMGPIWCAWGYGRKFTVEQVLATLPLAKELGFEWVGIDDGWQEGIGDWTPDSKKFPKGDEDMKKLVQEIHRLGMKAQLWWAPFAVHRKSKYAENHRDQLLLNRNQSKRDISWWDAWYLCPANGEVKTEMARLAKKFVGEWGFDGLKIDGQHLNGAPECFNKSHHHAKPDESHREFAAAFAEILSGAHAGNKNSLVEVCPCGTAYSIYHLPYQNMTVASDPGSSLQIRQKGKVLKALTGDQTVFFGDHVELSEKGQDFASTFAVGGLPGSNFTKLSFNVKPQPSEPDTRLTPEREAHWRKWIGLAKAKRLWQGEYLGDLYDIVFDVPEAHAVRMGSQIHFGFFAKTFFGDVELRGLRPGTEYEVTDYVSGKSLGSVTGPTARLKTEFKNFLLVDATPKTKDK